MQRTTEVLIEWLERYRGKFNLTRAGLARKLGISPQSLNSIYKGKRGAGPRFIARVCKQLGVEEREIFSPTEESGERKVSRMDELELAAGWKRLAEYWESIAKGNAPTPGNGEPDPTKKAQPKK